MPRFSFPLASLLAATMFMSAHTGAAAKDSAPTTAAEATQTGERLTLLGTGGGPITRLGRSQPASVLQVDDKIYLIDIGDGTPRQLVRAGYRLNQVDAIFITHLHFDHTAGTMGFMALDWQDRRKEPVTFYGPPGTEELVKRTLHALEGGEGIFRPQLPDLPAMNSIFLAKDWEVTTPREVYVDDKIRVTAVENSHYATMEMQPTSHGTDRAYSYRIETPTRSIVFTGDTGPSEAVEQLAQDVDILVAEIIDIEALKKSLKKRQQATGIDQQPLIDHMVLEHLTPEHVGRLAAKANAKKLVLYHFATPPGIEEIDQDTILKEIREHFTGPVEFGKDLANY